MNGVTIHMGFKPETPKVLSSSYLQPLTSVDFTFSVFFETLFPFISTAFFFMIFMYCWVIVIAFYFIFLVGIFFNLSARYCQKRAGQSEYLKDWSEYFISRLTFLLCLPLAFRIMFKTLNVKCNFLHDKLLFLWPHLLPVPCPLLQS